jgi:hypothetical protein
VNGYQIRARRHAREIVNDLRWRGMTVPPLYDRMAREFQELVRSGDYAAWVAASQKPLSVSGEPRERGLPGLVRTRPVAMQPRPLDLPAPLHA